MQWYLKVTLILSISMIGYLSKASSVVAWGSSRKGTEKVHAWCYRCKGTLGFMGLAGNPKTSLHYQMNDNAINSSNLATKVLRFQSLLHTILKLVLLSGVEYQLYWWEH